MRLVSLMLVLLLISGCDWFSRPTSMPAGYTYHNDLYKSPPGPVVKKAGSESSAGKQVQVIETTQPPRTGNLPEPLINAPVNEEIEMEQLQ